MSIATLKRKTQAKYNNMSVGNTHGFSINGTHRNQGYVGQTSLSRSLPRTLMKGNAIRGHGGCCGTYNVGPIVQSGVKSLEDSSVIKKSVLGTSGLISTKYKWIKRPQPYTSVKPDSNNNTNIQGLYITSVARKALEDEKQNVLNGCVNVNVSTNACANNMFKSPVSCYITKPIGEYQSLDSSVYINQISSKCQENDEFPMSAIGQSFTTCG